jgi:uncharacterized phage protein gp47/JayE
MSIDLPSRLVLHGIGRRYVLTRASKIDPAQVDTEGSDVNLFVGSQAFVGAATVRQLGEQLADLFLDSAEDEGLDRYAWDRYKLLRKGAAAALSSVRMFRPTAGGGAGNFPVGTRLQTQTGIEYITTAAAAFGASTLSVTGIGVRAVQAGKAFQVGANTIRRFAVPPFDTTIQVTNDEPTAGGEDREEDEAFRERVRDFWRTARRGILAAIAFGARQVPGIVSATAEEALTPAAQPARVVNLYVADSSGVANAALAQVVRNALLDFRAAGIAVIVTPSIPQIVDVELELTFAAGTDTSTLAELIRGAVFEFVNSLPVNGALYRAALFSLLQRFAGQGLIVADSTVIEPAGDLVPAPGRTLRTTLSNIVIV